MPPPRSNPNTDRGGATSNAKGGFSGPGVSGLNAPNRSAPSAAKGPTGGGQKGPAASQAAAKANATKTSNAKPTQTAGRVPGTSAAAAKNTALGKVAQTAKQAATRSTSGTSTNWGGRPMSSPLTAPNGSYYGPKGGNALNADARLAAARSVGFSQPAIRRTPGDADMLGRMMMVESGSIRNQFGLPRTVGLQGVADVVRNRVLSDQFPNTVPGVLTQRKQFSPIADGSFRRTPVNPMASRVAEAILSGEQPPVVGNALNYANIHTVNNLPGYSSAATRRAFNSMDPTAVIADARNPVSRSHTFGTIGTSDVAFNGPPAYSPGMPAAAPARPVQVASAALGSIPRPVPRPDNLRAPVPRPNPRPLQSFVAQDPRANLPPGAFPQTPRLSNVENYLMPGTTVTRNPYEERAAAQYGGYGTFNTPNRTAGLSRAEYAAPRPGYPGYGAFNTPNRTAPVSRNAFDTQRAVSAPNLGYGPASPLGNVPPAAERPRLVAGNIGGMSFTPPLPGPQRQMYDRVAQTPGPVPQYSPPAYPGSQPAGTYTAPYDRPPQMSPFGNVGQEYHQHTAPPTPSQYRNEPPPAAPNVGTPGSVTADAGPSIWEQGGNLMKVATDTIMKKADENKKAVEEIEKKVGKLTPEKVKLWAWANGLTGGGTTTPQPQYGNTTNDNAARYLQQAGAQMLGGPTMMGGGGNSEPQLTPAQMTELLTAMQAKGATPEEIAYVQSLMTTQTA